MQAAEVTFQAGVNTFFGLNGSGKTNFLEAIFTLCLGRSQRGAADTILLQDGAEVYRLVGQVQAKQRNIDVAVAYQKGVRKKITMDGVPIKASRLYEEFSVVTAGPEDSKILSGSPSARRLFLDTYISQLTPSYLADLTDYNRVLAQKNAALKNDMDSSAFHPLLVSYGAKIMLARGRFLRELGPMATARHGEIAPGEVLAIEYRPSVALESDEDDLEAVAGAFAAKLDEYLPKEHVLKTALVGPQRDEVTFTINGLPAKTHGSQGQWRTAALSLKLAVYELIRRRRKSSPVLLLDEIFAELDHRRCEHLMELFGQAEQLFITTAAEPPSSLVSGAKKYRIVQGRVEDEL